MALPGQPCGTDPGDMFVHYYTHVDLPPGYCRPLLDDPRSWLAHLPGARPDGERAWILRLAVAGLGKQVRLELGEPRGPEEQATIPLNLTVSPPSRLFPRLEGVLEIAGVGPGLTQVTVHGSYRPPLGPVGDGIDRALLHRLAEVALKRLVDDLARAMPPATEADARGRTQIPF